MLLSRGRAAVKWSQRGIRLSGDQGRRGGGKPIMGQDAPDVERKLRQAGVQRLSDAAGKAEGSNERRPGRRRAIHRPPAVSFVLQSGLLTIVVQASSLPRCSLEGCITSLISR